MIDTTHPSEPEGKSIQAHKTYVAGETLQQHITRAQAAIRTLERMGWTYHGGPKREPLTDEEIWRLMRDNDPTVYEAFRLAEASHGIGQKGGDVA